MTKCYICEKGNLERKKIDFQLYGKILGKFDAEVCDNCNEKFFDEEESDKIDLLAKKKGLFGLEAETKVTQAGNSLAIRIPKKIADFMHLKKSSPAKLYPKQDKLVIEFN